MMTLAVNTTPKDVLVLRFQTRNVAVLRDECATYQNAIAVVRSAFPSLRNVSADDIVLMANLPDYTLLGHIEISRGVWEHVRPIVSTVTVGRKSDEEAREVQSLKMARVQSSGP